MGWRLEPDRFQYLYFASGQGSLDLWTLFIKIYIGLCCVWDMGGCCDDDGSDPF